MAIRAYFPDALAGTALAGFKGSVLLLAADKGSVTVPHLASQKVKVASDCFLGGTGAVSVDLVSSLEKATR